MDSTSRLALNKPNPDPVTGDYVDIQKLNDNFDKIDSSISTTLCTSATRPTSPFQGQVILETDTGRMYVRVGSTWAQITVSGGRMLANIEYERAAGGDWAISAHVAGDAQKRFILDANGMLQWGPGGATTPDINLYRAGAGILKTDDALQVVGPLNGQLAVVKGSNTTRASNATIADDPDLQIPNLAVNATYLMDADILYYSATAVDIQVNWFLPAGASMEWSSWAPSQAHTGSPSYEGILKFESRNITQTQQWGGTGAIVHAMPRGCIQMGGTGGSFKMRWAQAVSNADGTIVYAKSWIRLQRVA